MVFQIGDKVRWRAGAPSVGADTQHAIGEVVGIVDPAAGAGGFRFAVRWVGDDTLSDGLTSGLFERAH